MEGELIPISFSLRVRFHSQQHPNEYIRGGTLRAVQKIREAELLEPLVPTVRSCMVSLELERNKQGSVG